MNARGDLEELTGEVRGRLWRIEAQLAIQQLVSQYAIALDSRDLEAMSALWSPEAWMGRGHGSGPEAVKAYFDPLMRRYYRSIHMIVGHAIHLDDEEHAHGTVYCRAEHETGDEWVVQAIAYEDTYRLVDGRWGFIRRGHRHWYSAPIERAPRPPSFEEWSAIKNHPPDLPHAWPSWDRFWAAEDPTRLQELTRHPGPAT